jgi:hypothetical protein
LAYVYRHIRLDKNEPFYIGIGSDDSGEYSRAYIKKERNKYWHHVIKKSNYDVEILLEDLTWEQACEKEKEFIALYGRKDLGLGQLVNMTDGGDGLINPSEATKDKIAKTLVDYNKSMPIDMKIKICDNISIGVISAYNKLTDEEKIARHSSVAKGWKSRSDNDKINYADIKSTQSKEVWSKRNNEEKDVIFKKISNSLKGKSNISLKNKKHVKIKCVYCDKQGGLNNMKRYHFDNCKYKNNGI